ncbi:MAG: hypothetical protein M5U12_11915 [Verrucomicrobia bacterium]|nr:hypothetical protein [Verrucomicrobiota bacterium]
MKTTLHEGHEGPPKGEHQRPFFLRDLRVLRGEFPRVGRETKPVTSPPQQTMKAKSIIQFVCSSLMFLAGTVAGHAAQFGDFTYESSGSSVTITGYTGPGGHVVIPDTMDGLPVTSIGYAAFRGAT